MKTKTSKYWLHAFVTTALLFAATAAWAGPPLLCHPFDIAGRPSLDWRGPGWQQSRADYDLGQLVARTEALLGPDAPAVARMETLRRAAIYASRDGSVVRALAARLEARVAAAEGDDARALALFDSGYLLETLEEIVRLQGYDMPGIGKVDTAALRTLLAPADGSVRIDRALALRPDDAGLRFGAALVAVADRREADARRHSRVARAGVGSDRLLALNIDLVVP